MIDHVSVPVRSLEASSTFYAAVLGALGQTQLETRDATVGFGKKYPEFWINLRDGLEPADPENGSHVCFRAATAAMVDAFHEAALAHGGGSEGAPGLRPKHGEGYYAAFVRDLDGNRLEAVSFVSGPLP
jgi:catechol 2,3-dioxygenase-like lactoylglutathione lyase family enzyme